MAMFLSRIKKILNLGTKSITQNGTYNASSDGYDGYSSVEVNVAGVTPTPITPSNASPVALTSGNAVTPSANGYAIESFYTITPSDVTPILLTSGNIYKMSGSGKAVASVTSKTPSDSSPASIPGGTIIKASSSGYLYSSSGLGKRKSGTFTSSTSSQTINLGFQPKYILIMSTALTTNIYDYSYSSTKGIYATANAGATEYTISGNTSNNHISAITSTGFTYNKSGSAGTTMYYFAIG